MIRVYYKTFCYGQEAIAWKTFKNLKKAIQFSLSVSGQLEVLK
jgi:hypothetical protein